MYSSEAGLWPQNWWGNIFIGSKHVANCISQIKINYDVSQWHYIQTNENVVYDCSRELEMTNTKSMKLIKTVYKFRRMSNFLLEENEESNGLSVAVY